MANSSNSSSSTSSRSRSSRLRSSASGRGGKRSSGRSSSSRSRSTSTGISSLPGQFSRSVIQPISRTVSQSSWMPYALGAVGLGLAIYGLSRISAVRSFVSPIGDSVSDLFGGSDMSSEYDDSFDFEEDVRVLEGDTNSLNRSI